MRNRAKCKLCDEIIESFHHHDMVTCKCGEISVDGGTNYFRCLAKDFSNFLRVDDEGNVIVPKIIEKDSEPVKCGPLDPPEPLKTQDLIDMLKEMIKNIEKLPENAMTLPINHYDFCSALMLVHQIFDKIKDE